MIKASSRALVLGTDELAARRRGSTTLFARTPLDMILVLEEATSEIAMVILAGQYARREDVAYFLREAYPDVVVHLEHDRADYQRAS